MKTDKETLLNTSLDLFYERGYKSVSIYDIGAAAGVTGAALYRHFGSKGEILGLLCQKTLDNLTACTGDIRDNPRQELDALIEGQVRCVIRHPKLLTVTQNEGRSLSTEWRTEIEERQRAHLKRWKDSIRALYPEEDLLTLDVAVYAAIGAINSAVRWPESLRGQSAFQDRLIDCAHAAMNAVRR